MSEQIVRAIGGMNEKDLLDPFLGEMRGQKTGFSMIQEHHSMPLGRHRIRHPPHLRRGPEPVEGLAPLAQQLEKALRATVLRPQLERLARQNYGSSIVAAGMLDARELHDQIDVAGRTLQPLVEKVAGAREVLVGRQQSRQTDSHLGPVRVPRQPVGKETAQGLTVATAFGKTLAKVDDRRRTGSQLLETRRRLHREIPSTDLDRTLGNAQVDPNATWIGATELCDRR